MPRRTVTKCSRRHAGERLSVTDETCLTIGHCFGVSDWERPLQSRADLVKLWARWGDELSARWAEAYPGSRPLTAYLVGRIQPPAWRHENPAIRHPVVVEGEVVLDDRAWHCREVELDHLVELGLVDDAEYEAAVERLDGPEPTAGYRYRALSRD